MTKFTLTLQGEEPVTGILEPHTTHGDVYRVRKWGDPIMVEQGGFSTELIRSSNFQAVGLYNKATNQQGGVSNFLRIPKADVMRLAALQVEDDFKDKQPGFSRQYNMEGWRAQKMNWLCKKRGTIYFYYHHAQSGGWKTLSYIEWGTIALGNAYVQVEDVETLNVATRDGVRRSRKMGRLVGFRPSDWDRPLQELVAAGLVHRCYCAYMGDDIGDTPKGIVYSPFWSPRDWKLIGPSQPQADAFYIPMDWIYKE